MIGAVDSPALDEFVDLFRDVFPRPTAGARTALLITQKRATRLGPAKLRDGRGLPMNIWF